MSAIPSSIPALRGPFAVGLREIECEAATPPESDSNAKRRLPTSVWYPSALAPEDLGRDVSDAPHLLGQPHAATLDLPPIDQRSPLIVFSHGNSGSRHQSTFLMTHLASWGVVVAAPDHVGNTFFDSAEREDPEEIRAAHRAARRDRPHDLLGVLNALAGPADGDDPQTGDSAKAEAEAELPPIDLLRLGALGHSFGGWSVLKLVGLDQRLRALCCLAPATEPFVARKAFAPDELPLRERLRTLVLAARDDVLVDYETSIVPLVGRLGPTAVLEVLEDLDHFHFCDGIQLLHQMHFNAPRAGQLRETRPYDAMLDEQTTHALLNDRVRSFFETAFSGE